MHVVGGVVLSSDSEEEGSSSDEDAAAVSPQQQLKSKAMKNAIESDESDSGECQTVAELFEGRTPTCSLDKPWHKPNKPTPPPGTRVHMLIPFLLLIPFLFHFVFHFPR